jgi:hypothetical protein
VPLFASTACARAASTFAAELGVIAWLMYWSPSVDCGIVSSFGMVVVPVATAPVSVRCTCRMSPGSGSPAPKSCVRVGPADQVPGVARPVSQVA